MASPTSICRREKLYAINGAISRCSLFGVMSGSTSRKARVTVIDDLVEPLAVMGMPNVQDSVMTTAAYATTRDAHETAGTWVCD